MKFFRHLILALALSGAAWAELPPIPDAANDPAWRELIAQLALTKIRMSVFEERRYFSFRKEPVVLTGEIRIVPELGLSLRYLTPEQRVIIVDAKGVLLRDAQGRNRPMPDDHRAQAATATLVSVLRFNLPELQKTFEVRGQRDGDRWTLAFAPRDPAVAKTLGSLVVTGEKSLLKKIEMNQPANQRIEILIGKTEEDVIFTGDTFARFFR